MRPRVKKVLRWLVAGLALLVVLIATAIFFKNHLLKTLTCWNIKANTGLEATIGSFDLDFANSQLRIINFRIYNAPAFGGSVLVEIPEIFCAVDSSDAAKGKVRFKEIRFNLAEANLVQDTNGLNNIDALKKAVEGKSKQSTGSGSHANGFEFGGIDKLVVTLGKINFIDLRQPENNAQIDLGVKDDTMLGIKTNSELEAWANALALRVTIQQAMSGAARPSKGGTLEMLLKQFSK
jgi:uncharacterized protein involved in outer membrane biogenesis